MTPDRDPEPPVRDDCPRCEVQDLLTDLWEGASIGHRLDVIAWLADIVARMREALDDEDLCWDLARRHRRSHPPLARTLLTPDEPTTETEEEEAGP
jgi:hypothetical protein